MWFRKSGKSAKPGRDNQRTDRRGIWKQVIRRLKKELSPEALRQAGEDATCEQVLEACETPKSQAEDAAYYEALAQNIRETAALSDDSIQECLAVAGIPATLQNIREMKQVFGKRNAGKRCLVYPGRK